MHVPNVTYFTSLASKVSAVPHRWGHSSSETSDLFLVIRKSGSLQPPPWPPAVRGVGPIADPWKRRTRDHTQRRKSSYSQERPGNSHHGSEFQPAETDAITAIPVSHVGSVQPQQVHLICKTRLSLRMKSRLINNLNLIFNSLDKNLWPLFFCPPPPSQTQGGLHTFSPDRLGAQSASRRARPRP